MPNPHNPTLEPTKEVTNLTQESNTDYTTQETPNSSDLQIVTHSPSPSYKIIEIKPDDPSNTLLNKCKLILCKELSNHFKDITTDILRFTRGGLHLLLREPDLSNIPKKLYGFAVNVHVYESTNHPPTTATPKGRQFHAGQIASLFNIKNLKKLI